MFDPDIIMRREETAMGKVIKITSPGAKEEKLQDIYKNLSELKKALAGVINESEEEAEETKLDALTEASDALEDAYDALGEILLDER